MTAYLTRRLATSVVILIGISIFIFALLHAVFTSPAIILGPKATPPAVAARNTANGFNAPVIVQYWHYRPACSMATSAIPTS